ncbi:MAG: exodeoxyribonuclease VII small subunit [Clostridia bacterium]|nr:exodeoxyribonuclease VII small subunit [Clostridia bacterium]
MDLKNSIDFEKSLNVLESVVSQLESGDISLDESVKLFEKGIKLSDDCRKTLENARQKIITLTEAEKEADENEAD